MPRYSQRRAIGYGSPGRRWTRGDRGDPVDSAIRRNYPDGSLTDPIFWMGTDSATAPNWSAYGAPPAWNSAYGGAPGIQNDYLTNDGILPAITRATSLIVNPVVETSWRFYQDAPKGRPTDVHISDEEVPRPLWIYDPQLMGKIPGGEVGRPTIPRPKRLGGHAFWKTLLTHSLWWGAGALLYSLDYNGQPLAGTLRIVNPAMWGYSDDGRYVLYGDEEPLESDFDGGWDIGGIRWEMKVVYGFPPIDGTVATGALTRSGLVLSTGSKMNSYLNSILSSGVPSGVLRVATPNYTQPQAQALKDQWMAAHGGATRSVAVLASGIDFTPLQLSVVDADAVAAKGAHLVDIAHAFNLSAAMLDTAVGTGSNITYANLGERRRDLLDHTLSSAGRSLEDLLSSLLPWGQSMSIEWGQYLSIDPNGAIPFVESGLSHGWLTIQEVRNIMTVTPTKNPELEAAQNTIAVEGEPTDEPADDNG